ncbi:MAG TPA: MFS transporter [Planctomycetota bacterium]|nr:MFS transporter [Planctomycetota bacterium]
MDAPPASQPKLRFPREKRRLGLLLSIFEGMSAQAQTCCSGCGGGAPNAITIAFAFWLGAQDMELAFLAALAVAGSFFQYLGAAILPRLASRKPIVAWSALVGRVTWLGIGAIPFLLSRHTGLYLFLFLWFLVNALLALSGNLWTSWMADLCPPPIRGRYFARRTAATTLVAVLLPLAISYVLDRWYGGAPDGLVEGTPLQARGFFLVFAAAAFFGVLCGFLITWQPEPPRDLPPGASHLSFAWLAAPFHDRRYRPLALFTLVFGAANGLANPFWTAFQLQDLELGYGYVNGWFVVLQGLFMVVSLPLWGRLCDRAGNRPAIVLALLFVCSHPYYYIFATKARWWFMFFDAGSSGLAWAGYNLAIFNLVLVLAPREERELYIATQAVIFGGAQAVFSLLAGSVVTRLPQALPFVGMALHPRQQVFLITAIARLACLGFFLGAVKEPKSKPIRVVIVAAGNFVKARMELFKLIPRD